MANINLLPWREQRREERRRGFLMALGATVLGAAALLLLADRLVDERIATQNARNAFLREQIAVLDGRLADIRQLRGQKEELTARMAVIEDLQGSRPLIVHLFDELARALPEGVYYDSVVRSDDTIRLEGVAESNALVSALMRELDASAWLAAPDLEQVTANTQTRSGAAPGGNRFRLTVRVAQPDPRQVEP